MIGWKLLIVLIFNNPYSHRPVIIRGSVRQILRYMHDGYIDIEQWTTFRDYLVKKDIGVSRLFDGIFVT